jgi:toxin ParE1/3/4
MSFTVFLTAGAAGDLEEFYDYIALHDAPGKSEQVLASIEKILSSLAESPERGTYPKELLALGIRDYREIFFKPYRVICHVIDDKVHVLLIVDGRRDMQTLLQRRLLDA